jgi:hypothetical protein
MSFKSDAIASIDQLPSKATYLDIQYSIYVLNKIKNGEDSLRESGGISQEKAKKMMKKWLTK